MSRIEELRVQVQPIAKKFKRMGFTITDVTSIGLLIIRDWDANKISKYIELLSEAGKDADSVVSAAEADLKEHKQKKNRLPSITG